MFFKDSSSVPHNFHLFHSVKTTFDRLPLGEGLISCIYDELRPRLHILEGDEVVGFFYNSFAFTQGMAEACTDDRFGIIIRPRAPFADDKQKVLLEFYVEKDALLSMFGEEVLPGLIKALYEIPERLQNTELTIPAATEEPQAAADEAADGRLYPYQMHNAAWIARTDDVLRRRAGRVDYIACPGRSFRVGNDMRIYFTTDGKIEPAENFPVESLIIRGLLVTDPLGMGKTASVIGGLKLARNTKTLIVVPAKVYKQWIEELKIAKVQHRGIVCKRGVKKHGPNFEGELYVTTLHFLVNKVHLEDTSFFSVAWGRVVLDEAHELTGKHPKKNFARWQRGFERVKAETFWLVTATPLAHGKVGIANMLRWVGHQESEESWRYLSSHDVAQKFLDGFARRTSESDISKWVQLPPLSRFDVLLTMTQTENALYEAERNSTLENLIQNMLASSLQLIL